MKSFLLNLGSQILRDALAPSDGRGGIITALLAGPKEEPQSTIEPDFEYLNHAAVRFFRTLVMGAVCGLFFVLGLFTAVISATSAYDISGQFVATGTFVASLLITLFAAIGVIVARRNVGKITFSWGTFLRGSTHFPVSPSVVDAVSPAAPAFSSAEMADAEVIPTAKDMPNRSERLAS